MTCVNRRTAVRVLGVAARRNLLRYTQVYAKFMGCLPEFTVFAAYFWVFLRKFGRFSRDFGPQMSPNWRDLATRRQLCDMCQQTNGRPCGTVLKSPAGTGACRGFYSQMRLIAVACERSRGKYPARYMVVRTSSRALGVYGICTDLYGFCTVFVRFCTEKRRKTGKNRPVRAAQRGAPGIRAPAPHARVAGRLPHAHDRLRRHGPARPFARLRSTACNPANNGF